MNLSLVGYAPSNHPEIAMAVLVPWAYQGNHDHKVNLKIGERVMDAYFELKKKRMEENKNLENTVQKVENIKDVQEGIRKEEQGQ